MPVVTGPIHGRSTRVIVEGQDLSCQLRDASISLNGDVVEATAFCNSLKAYVSGLPDGRMSLSGFLDAGTTGGNFSIFMPKFSRGQKISFVIQPQGNTVMGLAAAAEGLITSVQFSQTVSDMQSISMEVQLTGELYAMRTLIPITTQITGDVDSSMAEVDRSTAMEVPYTDVAYTSGMMFYTYYNDKATSRDFELWTTGAAQTNGTAPSASGTVVKLADVTVAAGAAVHGTVGTSLVPVTVRKFVSAWITGTLNADDIHFAYVGLIDMNESLLNR